MSAKVLLFCGADIIKTLLHHKINSYIIVALFGLAAGLLVVFFSRFPFDNLWSFSSFSSSTFGFWMFTTALIVLFTEKQIMAGINAFIYVYIMFLITGIHKLTRNNVSLGYDTIISNLAIYGLLPAAICGILGIILWNGRKNNLAGKILILFPLIFIISETVYMFYNVFTKHRLLFQSIIDTSCAFLYIIIFYKYMILKKCVK